MRHLFATLFVSCLAIPALAGDPDCDGDGTSDAAEILAGSLDCNTNLIPDECECVWNNGEPPADVEDINGQLSHIGGGAVGPGIDAVRVADDVILPPGYLHRVMSFRGLMQTDSLAPARRARVEIFNDCNGQPEEEPFFTSTNFQDVQVGGIGPDGFYIVWYTFDLCEDNLWLDGGKAYWFSLIGETDRVTTDFSNWVFTSPDDAALLSKLPVSATGQKSGFLQYTWEPWAPVCIGCPDCVNMVFALDGYSCPIIHDNGRPDLDDSTKGGIKSGPYASTVWRARDDFVIRMCENRTVCVLDAYVWANCNPMHGFIEIYGDAPCPASDGPPVLSEVATPPLFEPVSPTQVEDLGETLTIPGVTEPLRLYRMRLIEPAGWELVAGRTYWVSAGAAMSGSFGTKSLFAFADDCAMECDYIFNPPQRRQVSGAATGWLNAPLSERRNLAFRLAVAPLTPDGDGVLPPFAQPECRADLDLDGNYGVPDIFAFLTEWFGANCP